MKKNKALTKTKSDLPPKSFSEVNVVDCLMSSSRASDSESSKILSSNGNDLLPDIIADDVVSGSTVEWSTN